MFPPVLIILHFIRFLFTDSALVISLWKNYDKKVPPCDFYYSIPQGVATFLFQVLLLCQPITLHTNTEAPNPWERHRRTGNLHL